MANKTIFQKQLLQNKVVLKAHEINPRNIGAMVLSKLRKKIGNKCINEGYVKKDTIQIINRSIGIINSHFLDGSIEYNIQYEAEVCRPKEADILKAYVDKINDYGISAKVYSAPFLEIVVPKQLQPDPDIFEKIDRNTEEHIDIIIKIVGMDYELNSNKIIVIAELLEVIQ